MAKNKTSAKGKSKKSGSAALQAVKPQIKVADSKIKPQPPTAHAKVTVKDGRDSKTWDLPVLKGTLGPDVIDVGLALYAQRNHVGEASRMVGVGTFGRVAGRLRGLFKEFF